MQHLGAKNGLSYSSIAHPSGKLKPPQFEKE